MTLSVTSEGEMSANETECAPRTLGRHEGHPCQTGVLIGSHLLIFKLMLKWKLFSCGVTWSCVFGVIIVLEMNIMTFL